jgi:hypothetical protein
MFGQITQISQPVFNPSSEAPTGEMRGKAPALQKILYAGARIRFCCGRNGADGGRRSPRY